MVCPIMAVLKVKNMIGSFMQRKVKSRHFIQSRHVVKHWNAFTVKFSLYIKCSKRDLDCFHPEKLRFSGSLTKWTTGIIQRGTKISRVNILVLVNKDKKLHLTNPTHSNLWDLPVPTRLSPVWSCKSVSPDWVCTIICPLSHPLKQP